jgi:hypothetical protein
MRSERVTPAPMPRSMPTPAPRSIRNNDTCPAPAPYRQGRPLLGVRMASFPAGSEHFLSSQGYCVVRSTAMTITAQIPIYEGDE